MTFAIIFSEFESFLSTFSCSNFMFLTFIDYSVLCWYYIKTFKHSPPPGKYLLQTSYYCLGVGWFILKEIADLDIPYLDCISYNRVCRIWYILKENLSTLGKGNNLVALENRNVVFFWSSAFCYAKTMFEKMDELWTNQYMFRW